MVRIEPFGNHDVLELVRMWRESFEHGVGVRDPHPIEDQAAYFTGKVLPEYTVRVAMGGAAIVGFSATTPESIGQLYVRVADIGRGIGSRLVELAKAESAGSLWLYTFARNAAARRFYERHGFVAVEFGFELSWKLEDVRYRWQRPTPDPGAA